MKYYKSDCMVLCSSQGIQGKEHRRLCSTSNVKILELEQLDLKSRLGLQEILHGSMQVPDMCFSKLDTLIVDNCQCLSDAVLPFQLLPLLPKLESLEFRNSDSVKTIFDVKCTTQYILITFPLKKLVSSKLPNLENVWNQDMHATSKRSTC